jgi:hypothetical protein
MLIQSWVSLKSLKRKDGKGDRKDDGDKGNPSVDFRGEIRSNATHESGTDPQALLYTKSKGTAARLCSMGHVLAENRNGFTVAKRLARTSIMTMTNCMRRFGH